MDDSRLVRVLVIRLSSLGDVALTEPVVRAIRTRHPEARIDFVTDTAYAGWVGTAFDVDHAYGFDRRGRDAGLRGLRSMRAQLAKGRYDLVIDLQGKLRTRCLAAGLGTRRLGFVRRTLSRTVQAVVGRERPDHDRHAIEALLDVVRPLGFDLPLHQRRIQLRRPSDAAMAGPPVVPYAPRGPRRLKIGLCAGASMATKRWPAESFGRLTALLAERLRHAQFVAVGGRDDRERFAVIRRHVTSDRWDEASLGGNIEALATTVAGLDLLISNDTGPAHLAYGYRVPTLVLFGPTSWIRWGPPADRGHGVVRLALDCAPCSNFGGRRCPRADRRWACLRNLDPMTVAEAAARLVSKAAHDACAERASVVEQPMAAEGARGSSP